ncbi:MAG: aspartate/glutamate racemase family protein [Clostridia bacterium]|nr:aspartate/glutamate racemase family protein [Clostridia bacterium]
MIGFFDSGKGGLTVLAKAIKEGVGGDVLYFGDETNAPFGSKDKESLKRIVRDDCRFLERLGCEKVVCACNTASVASENMRLNIPFSRLRYEFEAIKGDALFLGTEFSVKNFASRSNERIKCLALPLLATLIDDDASEEEIFDYVSRTAKGIAAPTLILGCTHYGLVKGILSRVFLPEKIIEIGDSVSKADIYGDESPLRVFFLDYQYKKYSLVLERLLEDERVNTFSLPLNKHIPLK